MNYKTLIFCLSIIAFSCNNEVQDSEFEQDGFFDLEKFVDQQLDKELILPSVKRIINLDGKVESSDIENFNKKENLVYLEKFNINQPRWYDKYTVEKTGNQLIYTARDSSLRVERFELKQNDDEVVSIDIKYKTGTFISSTKKNIHWEPGNILRIDNQNKSLWTEPSRLQIEWQFTQ